MPIRREDYLTPPASDLPTKNSNAHKILTVYTQPAGVGRDADLGMDRLVHLERLQAAA